MKTLQTDVTAEREQLYSYIIKTNSSRVCAGSVKFAWCVGIAFVVVLSLVFLPADLCCLVTVLAAIIATLWILLREVVYFQRTSEFSYGLRRLSYGEWDYMERVYFRACNSYFFRRIIRSHAFIMIAGFYYQFKVGDAVSGAKLLALACERDDDLKPIAMSVLSRHRLLPREQEVLIEKFRRDLGVAWIYKFKQNYKGLWAIGSLLMILLICIKYFMDIVNAFMLLFRGPAN